MKILFVFSQNHKTAPFIIEQIQALNRFGIATKCLGIKGKGILGYLNNRKRLISSIDEFAPHIVHAHYGLSGLLACFQKKVPVVITFHGSDVNCLINRPFSFLAAHLSHANICVAEHLSRKLHLKHPYIIPCGVEFMDECKYDKDAAKAYFHFSLSDKYILFAGDFSNKIKNHRLAKKSVEELKDEKTHLVELKGFSKKEVYMLLRACDALLLTSKSEGSPQIIKEALLCNCPVVSVPVGDVAKHLTSIPGCFITHSLSPNEIAFCLAKAMNSKITVGSAYIENACLYSDAVAKKIIEVYKDVLNHA